MISFLIILHIVSAFFYNFGVKALLPVLYVVITTTILDLLIGYVKNQRFLSMIENPFGIYRHFKFKTSGMRVSGANSLTTHEFPQSALISGLFIGGLLTQNLQWYVYVLAGIIAILSKHLIRIQQKHIFNPANFGILLVSIIFGVSHTWWISSPLLLVLIFGIFVIWRLRRFDLTISFLVSYYLINSIIELIRGAQFQEIYFTIINGGVIYFFSMYMLVEPRTNPNARKQRIVYGFLVAVLFILFHFFIPRHDLPLALAIGNIFVPVLNMSKIYH